MRVRAPGPKDSWPGLARKTKREQSCKKIQNSIFLKAIAVEKSQVAAATPGSGTAVASAAAAPPDCQPGQRACGTARTADRCLPRSHRGIIDVRSIGSPPGPALPRALNQLLYRPLPAPQLRRKLRAHLLPFAPPRIHLHSASAAVRHRPPPLKGTARRHGGARCLPWCDRQRGRGGEGGGTSCRRHFVQAFRSRRRSARSCSSS